MHDIQYPTPPHATRPRLEGAPWERLLYAVESLDLMPSPDAVAAFLRDAHITGAQGSATAHRLAVYLRRRARTPQVAIFSGWAWLDGRRKVKLGEAAWDFVERFDDGAYPELEVTR
jgi:hypothetical protein